MALELVTIPCLKDNYAYLLHDPATGATACIDVPEAPPILAALAERGWQLSEIWLTHHHWDHIDGVAALVAATGARTFGAKADAHRLPPLDTALTGDFTFAGHAVQVIDVPGHTVGHIAFHLPQAKLAFTADSLMAAGCGRLFEGTPDQMHESLQKLVTLPPETLICSGHEYTTGNIRFALTLEPANAALISRSELVASLRAAGKPTVPVMLSEELATNPFLRTHSAEIRANLNLGTASDVKVFAEIRSRKDSF
ncbi:hydroxyacylglutathione hydrolase [Gemmobacter aquarius]|uniref:Hydroxyacylglutathione hydrolase n=1 Tax=Paragemmobacter aquarius TaxID=2169400 RepID=A0A2S0UPS3_9RHOB|nr:hydroxyacylglutathione hydrolase [Gemmobacter aquarius]AWB49806.1 hydroxyacylglutathione hydrolase [Gemmobacter aquarius]